MARSKDLRSDNVLPYSYYNKGQKALAFGVKTRGHWISTRSDHPDHPDHPSVGASGVPSYDNRVKIAGSEWQRCCKQLSGGLGVELLLPWEAKIHRSSKPLLSHWLWRWEIGAALKITESCGKLSSDTRILLLFYFGSVFMAGCLLMLADCDGIPQQQHFRGMHHADSTG